MASKGQKFKIWTTEEKYELIKPLLNMEKGSRTYSREIGINSGLLYSWVKKYDDNGETALIDRRGHHKTDEEVDEIERLSRENKRLKRQLEEKDMVVELLKKVQEIERRRY